MAKLTIDTGAAGNPATGDTLRTAMTKVNANFDEVYQLVGDGSTGLITTAITNGDLKLQANGTGTIEIDTLSITNSTITSITKARIISISIWETIIYTITSGAGSFRARSISINITLGDILIIFKNWIGS